MEKKQNFSLRHQLTNRWRTLLQNILLTFLALLMAIKVGATTVEST